MGIYIRDELPTEFNGITMKEAVYWADVYLTDNPCDRMWDAVRALRDFCECIVDTAIKIPTPHGRLIDAEYLKEHLYQCEINGRPLHIMELNERLACITDVPTVIEAEGEEK